MSALANKSLASPFPLIYSRHSTHHFSKPQFLLLSNFKPFKTCSALSATPHASTPHPSLQIFLPFLQEQEQKSIEDEHEDEEKEEENLMDPILNFFKTQTSIQDPPRLGKLSLQKNRRSSWHLSPHINSINQPGTPIDSDSDFDDVVIPKEEKQHAESSPHCPVSEILQIARNLPENSTLGEVLGSYHGRVSKRECVQLLGLMAEEGLLMGCLYFYEWMRLHEPSLESPRACSVLFPILGKARMGDYLMILFKNLPQSNEFRDVHVYNAVISGLCACGRYEIFVS